MSSVVSGRPLGRVCAASPRAPSKPAATTMTMRACRIMVLLCRGVSVPRLEIELHADLEQSCVENAQRHEPRGVIVVLARDRVGVERVVEIEVDGSLRPREVEDL